MAQNKQTRQWIVWIMIIVVLGVIGYVLLISNSNESFSIVGGEKGFRSIDEAQTACEIQFAQLPETTLRSNALRIAIETRNTNQGKFYDCTILTGADIDNGADLMNNLKKVKLYSEKHGECLPNSFADTLGIGACSSDLVCPSCETCEVCEETPVTVDQEPSMNQNINIIGTGVLGLLLGLVIGWFARRGAKK